MYVCVIRIYAYAHVYVLQVHVYVHVYVYVYVYCIHTCIPTCLDMPASQASGRMVLGRDGVLLLKKAHEGLRQTVLRP